MKSRQNVVEGHLEFQVLNKNDLGNGTLTTLSCSSIGYVDIVTHQVVDHVVLEDVYTTSCVPVEDVMNHNLAALWAVIEVAMGGHLNRLN